MKIRDLLQTTIVLSILLFLLMACGSEKSNTEIPKPDKISRLKLVPVSINKGGVNSSGMQLLNVDIAVANPSQELRYFYTLSKSIPSPNI